MKKGIVVLILSVLLSAGLAAETVLLVTGEYPPYVEIEKPGFGLASEIITAAFKTQSIDVDYQFVPWLRCEAMVQNGDALGTFPYFWNEEREKTYNFSDPLYKAGARFFILKEGRIPESMVWESYEDFAFYRAGGIPGYWYEEGLKASGVNLSLVSSGGELSLIRMLAAKRIDFFISDEAVAWSVIKNDLPHLESEIVTLAKPESVDSSYIMASRSYPNADTLLAKFNVGLATIKNNGEYEQIMKKYGLVE